MDGILDYGQRETDGWKHDWTYAAKDMREGERENVAQRNEKVKQNREKRSLKRKEEKL